MNPSLRLYRRILKLHKNLPLIPKALGDQYLRDEFRRHKNATQEQITEFIQEWKVGIYIHCSNSIPIYQTNLSCIS